MSVKRFDISSLDFMMEDNNGFLKGDGIVTRTGVFTYVNADGTLRRELRHPDDVLRIDSLKTMKMIPITNNHPADLVNPQNAQELTIGFVGENIRPDGSHVAAPVSITVGSAIEEVHAGKRQLSLGYTVDVIEEAGEYDGISYQYRQTNIRYNHLALVNKARAGDKAKLKFDGFNLDEGDAILCTDEIKDDDNSSKNKQKPKQEVDVMSKTSNFNIDGISYDAAPEVVNFINKLQSKHDTIEGELNTKLDEVDKLNEKVTTLTANLDDANSKIKKLENTDHSESVNKAVKERVDIMQIAEKVVDTKKNNLDEMSNEEIMKAVIVSQDSDAKFDGIDEDQLSIYIKARYDSAVSVIGKKKVNKQKQTVNNTNNSDSDDEHTDADDARKQMIKDMKNPKLS